MSAGEANSPEVGRHGARPKQEARSIMANLTPEERQVIRECNNESFYKRSLPLGVVFVFTTFVLTKRGAIKQTSGPIRYMSAAVAGFFLGKFSYQGVCRDKIMRLENSPLAEAMRAARRGPETMQEMGMQEMQGQVASPSPRPGSDYSPALGTDYYSNTDIDTAQNVTHEGLDDSQRPSLDREQALGSPEAAPSRPSTTYSDLRRQNRAEYEGRRPQNAKYYDSRSPPSPAAPTGPDMPPPPAPPSSAMYSSSGMTTHEQLKTKKDPVDTKKKWAKRNQYGDIIEE